MLDIGSHDMRAPLQSCCCRLPHASCAARITSRMDCLTAGLMCKQPDHGEQPVRRNAPLAGSHAHTEL